MPRITLEYSEAQEDILFNWPEGVKYKMIDKGRRSGLTKGFANGVVDLMCQGIGPILWVDTVQGNLQRYIDRYFVPELKKNGIKYTWNVQQKQLTINGQYCDFRSEEQGDAIEGFGYRYIILNEAGIILSNRKLYVESILPMLLDFPDSKLIAGGVPKGRKTKNGEKHLFYELCERAKTGEKPYMHYHLTAYDNPWIDEDQIKALEMEMFATGGQRLVDQEVYGQFVDNIVTNRFLIHFTKDKHTGKVMLDKDKQLYVSIDFNRIPFCLGAWHKWRDQSGEHAHKVFELEVDPGSVPLMIQHMNRHLSHWIPTMKLTGDHGGKRKSLSLEDNADYYQQLQRGLRLRDSQIVVPANPTHVKSSAQFNYVLFHHPDFKYGDHLEKSIFDAENVEVDPFGEIIKDNRKDAAKRADHLDTDRYFVNTFMQDWVKEHQARAKI